MFLLYEKTYQWTGNVPSHNRMDLILSKGQDQGQVKYGHEVKMLFRYLATHVLWVIWDAEFDGGIHFYISPRKGQVQVKPGQIRSNSQIQNFLTKTHVFCVYKRTIRNNQNMLETTANELCLPF